MKVSVIHPTELDRKLTDKWHLFLTKSSLPDTPFLYPEFVIAVGHHRSDARVALIEEGGKLVGFLPYQTRLTGFGRAIAFGMSDFQACVVDPAFNVDLRQVLSKCHLARWQVDHFLGAIGSPVNDLSLSAVSPVINCAAGFACYSSSQAAASPGFKRAQRKQRRFAEAYQGQWSYVWNSASLETLSRLMVLKGAQCRSAGAYDYTRHRWIRGLLEELCNLSGESIAGVQSELRVGDEIIASHFGLRSRTRLHWWLPAYEPRWKQWNPGSALLLETIKASSERGVERIDLGKDLTRYKKEFMNESLVVQQGIFHLSSWGRRVTAIGNYLRQADQSPGRLIALARPVGGVARRVSRWLRFA
jgi:CelD/BcsL family acetyltransferase involved in cellulose biosynthesis